MKKILIGPSAKQPALVSHYRAIGPAAIVAALLLATRKKKPAPKSPASCIDDED